MPLSIKKHLILGGHGKCKAVELSNAVFVRHNMVVRLAKSYITREGRVGMSRQHWMRGTWGIAAVVVAGAVTLADPPQTKTEPQNKTPNATQQPAAPVARRHERPLLGFAADSSSAANAPGARSDNKPGLPTPVVSGAPQMAHAAMQPAAAGSLDQLMIKVLSKSNCDEIEMAKVAEQRSTNPEVKKLAQQLVQDHTRFQSRLDSIKKAQPAAQAVQAHNDHAGKTHAHHADAATAHKSAAQPAATAHQATAAAPAATAKSDAAKKPVTAATQTAKPEPQQVASTDKKPAPTAAEIEAGIKSSPFAKAFAASSHTVNKPAAQAEPAVAAKTSDAKHADAHQPMAAAADHHKMGDHGHAGHAATAGHAHVAGQFVHVMEEVDQRTQQALMRELSEKNGVQFDRCYLGSQVFNHMWMIEALTVFEQQASPELKSALQEGLQASQQHLTHMKALMAQLDSTTEDDRECPTARCGRQITASTQPDEPRAEQIASLFFLRTAIVEVKTCGGTDYSRHLTANQVVQAGGTRRGGVARCSSARSARLASSGPDRNPLRTPAVRGPTRRGR